MDSDLFTRADWLDGGYTPSSLRNSVGRKRIERLAYGIYATSNPAEADELWFRDLRVLTSRSRTSVAICGVAAALLHGLDGFELAYYNERPLTAVTHMTGNIRAAGMRRSRLFDASRIVYIKGIAVTNVVDTVADLGYYVQDDDWVEIALESILRGDDPRQPDLWHCDRLSELIVIASRPGSKGYATLGRVLRRRGNVGPTYSAAETLAALGSRKVGLALQRQVRVRIFNRHHRLVYTYWLDFADIARRVAVEIDGKKGHATKEGTQRDYRRDNILGSVFTVLRYTAAEVRRDPSVMARQVQHRLDSRVPIIGPWQTKTGLQVIPCGSGLDIIDPSL